MNIYSWNMLFRNREQKRALSFIESSDFDFFCLQEVPEEFLQELQARFPYCASAVETSRAYAGVTGTQYLVTLSRYPITQKTELALSIETASPARASWFTELMVALRLWGKGVGVRNNLHIACVAPNLGMVHVYNLHLPLKHPRWRLKEFEAALINRDRREPAIVCGDFNVIESPHISILNWLLGGTVADALFYKRERATIEKRFVEHELVNPLRGKSTHPVSYSQLDHILVSRNFRITQADVNADRYGSDHHPIRVVADFHTD
jgi:endonuclease/exonuclease/phosphatase family metal-dependent hydrolase